MVRNVPSCLSAAMTNYPVPDSDEEGKKKKKKRDRKTLYLKIEFYKKTARRKEIVRVYRFLSISKIFVPTHHRLANFLNRIENFPRGEIRHIYRVHAHFATLQLEREKERRLPFMPARDRRNRNIWPKYLDFARIGGNVGK